MELLQVPLGLLVLGDQQLNPCGRVREVNRGLVGFCVDLGETPGYTGTEVDVMIS